LGFGGPAHAALLTVSWLDQDDSSDFASPDLLSVTLTFDNTTGLFTIELTASSAAPFQGTPLANVNLLNVDTGTTANDPALFLSSSVIRDTGTLVEVTGTNLRLLSWDLGDRVTHCRETTGCNANFDPPLDPPFTQLFGTGITADILFANDSVSVISAAPEPGTGMLMAMAAGAILLGSRTRREPGRNR
jgi:hypothetical protein